MHTCDDMLLMCLWKGKPIDCSEIFSIHKTDDGFCCSFNALKITDQFVNAEEINPKYTKDDMDDFYDEYSDDEDNIDYFWGSVESFHGCGGLLTEKVGLISSPSKQNDILQCEWIIRASSEMRIQLMFLSFRLDNGKDYKCSDYVSVYDGGFVKFPLLGRYCGFILPPDHFSSGNQLLIRYYAESSLDEEGFAISYRMLSPDEFSEVNMNFINGKILLYAH